MLKILVLSDLNWHENSKKINREDIFKILETQRAGSGARFQKVLKYWKLVQDENPQIVLFAGDITGDGSCGHGFHTAFFYLLTLLEIKNIPTFFVRGDNDLEPYYKQVTSNLGQYRAKDISGKLISVNGINLYGLSYQYTNETDLLARLDNLNDYKIDILLCHCELKRRTALLDKVKAGLIITGHFDNKICNINNVDFISLSNDSQVINYATIDYTSDNELRYTYNFIHPEKKLHLRYLTYNTKMRKKSHDGRFFINDIEVNIAEYEAMELPYSNYEKEKNSLALALKFLRGQNYSAAITYMLEAKRGAKIKKKVLSKMMKAHITARHKLSRTMLADYLGAEIWKFFKK